MRAASATGCAIRAQPTKGIRRYVRLYLRRNFLCRAAIAMSIAGEIWSKIHNYKRRSIHSRHQVISEFFAPAEWDDARAIRELSAGYAR